jgi:hypothetical protein
LNLVRSIVGADLPRVIGTATPMACPVAVDAYFCGSSADFPAAEDL